MNKYTLKLTDDYADSRYEDVSYYYVVETDKSKEQVERAYNKAHDEWEEDNEDKDCLIAYIEEELEKQGIILTPLQVDLELDF